MIPPWIFGTTGAVVALSLIALAACRSTNGTGEVTPQEVLTFEDMGAGVTSGMADAGLHVLRDQAALDALWRTHMRLQLPVPAVPVVDFDESMVVAAFAGQKSTGGYSIRIEQVQRLPETADQPSQIIVRTSESVPGDDAIVTQMITSPFHMVLVQKADGDGVLVTD